MDARAFKALVRAAVAWNGRSAKKRSPRKAGAKARPGASEYPKARHLDIREGDELDEAQLAWVR